MNKKIIVFTIVGLFLIGIITSGIIGLPKNISLTENSTEVINNINNKTIQRGDIVCNERTCSQKMWKGEYNLGLVEVSRYKCEEYDLNNTCISEKLIKDDNIIEEITKQQEKFLEELSKVIQKREEERIKDLDNLKVISDSGEVVINE